MLYIVLYIWFLIVYFVGLFFLTTNCYVVCCSAINSHFISFNLRVRWGKMLPWCMLFFWICSTTFIKIFSKNVNILENVKAGDNKVANDWFRRGRFKILIGLIWVFYMLHDYTCNIYSCRIRFGRVEESCPIHMV